MDWLIQFVAGKGCVMFRKRLVFPQFLLSSSLILLMISGACLSQGKYPLQAIKLPPGFKIEIYFDGLPDARSITLGDKGTLFVGTRHEGKVYAVVDTDGDNKPDKKYIIAEKKRFPNGVAFRNGSLYVSQITNISRYDNIEDRLDNPPKPEVIYNGFPNDKRHGWKFIRFGPDGKLYVPVGAPGNLVLRKEPIFASLTRMNPDGSDFEIFASGIRNTVGFDWLPETKELWFTENGADNLGDDFPPDELNCAPKAGLHFGYPYFHATEPDRKYGKGRKYEDYTPPAMQLGPHVAALGMSFYTGDMFPEEYKNRIFIAEHGSWNRTEPIGYRVTQVVFKDGKPVKYEPFAEGWLGEGRAWGRPVDVLVMPDGALLVSDDWNGVIYRISYDKPTNNEMRED